MFKWFWTIFSLGAPERRHRQPPSVHLWAYCTHPAHDVMCGGWPQHRGLRPLRFFVLIRKVLPFADVISKAALSSQLFNPFTARVNVGVPSGSSNFWVCGQNPMMWPFKWNLPACTFKWCYLFPKFYKTKFGDFCWILPLATLGTEKVKDPECWSGRGLNPLPPAQQTGTLLTELTRRR